ncbi:hypothetical protein Tco_0343126 [Tanacetum coccineum]
MGELLLNTKGSQMQRGVLKQNATKPNSAKTSISSGSRRQLVDKTTRKKMMYDPQDREEVGYEDDENEDMEDD